MRGLTYLFLANNGFEVAEIPPFLYSMTNLTDLSLKNTSLNGSIPPSMGNLTNLRLLDLDSNNISGQIPLELSTIDPLTFLLLNRNNLTGSVPEHFSNSSVLMLLVDNNSLTGNMSFICDGKFSRDLVIADCGGENPEILCTGSCCTCCEDGDECADEGMLANLDP